MFDQKISPHLLKKAALLFMIGSKIAYSEVTDLPLETSLSEDEIVVKADAYFSALNYDGKFGYADLFIVGDTNHWCVQLGGIYKTAGFGVGYRWLSPGAAPEQDYFIGIHAARRLFSQWRKGWDGTVEFGNSWLQSTLNGYFIQKDSEPVYARQELWGTSLKFTGYGWQKMNTIGRLNPLFFGALTKVATIGKNDEMAANAGFGVRWEYRYYADIAVELKVVWDSLKEASKWGLLGCHYDGGIQINLAGRSDPNKNYVINRIKEIPQRYQPSYSIENKNKSAVTSDARTSKETKTPPETIKAGQGSKGSSGTRRSGSRVTHTRADSKGSPTPLGAEGANTSTERPPVKRRGSSRRGSAAGLPDLRPSIKNPHAEQAVEDIDQPGKHLTSLEGQKWGRQRNAHISQLPTLPSQKQVNDFDNNTTINDNHMPTANTHSVYQNGGAGSRKSSVDHTSENGILSNNEVAIDSVNGATRNDVDGQVRGRESVQKPDKPRSRSASQKDFLNELAKPKYPSPTKPVSAATRRRSASRSSSRATSRSRNDDNQLSTTQQPADIGNATDVGNDSGKAPNNSIQAAQPAAVEGPVKNNDDLQITTTQQPANTSNATPVDGGHKIVPNGGSQGFAEPAVKPLNPVSPEKSFSSVLAAKAPVGQSNGDPQKQSAGNTRGRGRGSLGRGGRGGGRGIPVLQPHTPNNKA